MVLKGVAKALGYVSKDDLDAAMNNLLEERTKSDEYRNGKEREIALLKEHIALLEKENKNNQNRLNGLSEDLKKISDHYGQTLEDFKISEENSNKTREFFEKEADQLKSISKERAEQKKELQDRYNEFEKQYRALEKECRKIEGQKHTVEKKLKESEMKVKLSNREYRKLEKKLKKLTQMKKKPVVKTKKALAKVKKVDKGKKSTVKKKKLKQKTKKKIKPKKRR